MRITDSMRFNTMVNNLNNTQSDYNEISEQIATQKKVNRASDDPVAATRILDIRRGKAAIEQYKQNMEISSSWISATETTLSSAYDMLKTATGIAHGKRGGRCGNPGERGSEYPGHHRFHAEPGQYQMGRPLPVFRHAGRRGALHRHPVGCDDRSAPGGREQYI